MAQRTRKLHNIIADAEEAIKIKKALEKETLEQPTESKNQ
jgi:hypothetical protein